MTRYTAPEIIGMFLCCDINDVDRYQPTLFPTVGVYTADGDDYYCCPRAGQRPPVKDRDGFARGYVWKPVWTHQATGRVVYCASGTEEA